MLSSAKFTTQDLTRLSILLALAIALRLVENSLPYIVAVPGARLGLANCLTIVVLYLYGFRKTSWFLLARIVLVGLISTGLFSSGFWIGLGGAVFSFAAMALAQEKKWLSPVGVGLLGAFCHNCGQIIVAEHFLAAPSLFYYLPLLILVGIPTGLLTGFLAGMILKRIK